MKSKIINIKELIKGILIIGLYFTLPSLINIPFIFLAKKFNLNNGIMTFLLYLILAITFCLIYNKTLINDLKTFKLNYKKYLKKSFNYWLKGLFIMITSNIIINFVLKLGTSVNEQANIQLIKQSPLTLVPIVVLLAPCIEELVFRKSFAKISDNKHIFAWITGLIFGGVHVISSLSDPRTIIFLIPYCSIGIAFGYLYKKTDTIFSSLSMHILHNTINIAIILLAIMAGVNI